MYNSMYYFNLTSFIIIKIIINQFYIIIYAVLVAFLLVALGAADFSTGAD